MRKTCLDQIYQLAKKDDRVFFIGSDLGVGTLDKFKREMPQRFLMEGVCEANIIGIASGLALEGKIVYFNTISSFITRRCFEQLVLDVCLHNLNVRLIGNGGGLVYAPLGPTHLAIEDIAILRTIPNMTVVAPADASEMKRLMPQTLNYPGPIYIRLGKGGDPIVTPEDQPFEIGRAVLAQDGDDALLVTTGITLKAALDAAGELSKRGISVAALHMPTIKPIDKDALIQYASKTNIVVTIEEGVINGGLGGAVAEIIAEACFDPAVKFRRIGIPDVFADKYGSQKELLNYYEITPEKIVSTVTALSQSGKENLKS